MATCNGRCLSEPESGCDGHCCAVAGCCIEREEWSEYCEGHEMEHIANALREQAKQSRLGLNDEDVTEFNKSRI